MSNYEDPGPEYYARLHTYLHEAGFTHGHIHVDGRVDHNFDTDPIAYRFTITHEPGAHRDSDADEYVPPIAILHPETVNALRRLEQHRDLTDAEAPPS